MDRGVYEMSSKDVEFVLLERLNEIAKPETKEWFENYLKNRVVCRGVKTPEVEKELRQWYKEEGIAELSISDQLQICNRLVAGEYIEDKLAALILIQKFLIKKVEPEGLLELINDWFLEDYIEDWSTNDWLCVRVLGPLLKRNGKVVSGRLQRWVEAEHIWKRRSSIISFRAVVKDEDYIDEIEDIIGKTVEDDRRFVQTGIGWLVSDLSRQSPEKGEELVEKHYENLIPEVIRRHTKYLPKYKEYKERLKERRRVNT